MIPFTKQMVFHAGFNAGRFYEIAMHDLILHREKAIAGNYELLTNVINNLELAEQHARNAGVDYSEITDKLAEWRPLYLEAKAKQPIQPSLDVPSL